jgi:hypothetical protein
VSLMGRQENGHVNLVERPPSSASAATEGHQLGSLLNASLSVSSWSQSACQKCASSFVDEAITQGGNIDR